MKRTLTCLSLLVFSSSPALSWSPGIQAEGALDGRLTPIIGKNRDYVVAPGETLMEIAVRAGIGYRHLAQANPGTDPWHPAIGSLLTLPLAFRPPVGLADGLTVNLSDMRLFLVWKEDGQRFVRAYPLGIGREGWDTPRGDYRVTGVVHRPAWTPPLSLRKEKPDLPAVIPPGPDNPLGEFWIGTSATGIGFHGTNQPFGVGRRVSHGCMRLYPRDIRDLARRVYPGMPVRILDQP